jgi:hypothetical protein
MAGFFVIGWRHYRSCVVQHMYTTNFSSTRNCSIREKVKARPSRWDGKTVGTYCNG